jgi:ATP/maltotriose-dependent transcriptional regulator MalT
VAEEALAAGQQVKATAAAVREDVKEAAASARDKAGQLADTASHKVCVCVCVCARVDACLCARQCVAVHANGMCLSCAHHVLPGSSVARHARCTSAAATNAA